jgi:O-antigen ligase
VFTIPGAKESYGPWRGLAKSKNNLGPIALFSIIIWFSSIKNSTFYKRIFNFFMFLISLVLLIGAKSFTDELTLFILLCIWIGLSLDKYFNVITDKKALFIISLLWSIGFLVTIFYVDPKWIGDLFNVGGKNLTLTGRTDLWGDIFKIADKHLIYGCGFQGFWVIGSPWTNQLYQKYIWIPLQAHNGYIDILNETGIIGLSLFILTFIKYFSSLAHYEKQHFWKWIVVATILINITESTFIRPQLVAGVMYIFGYLALMSDIYKDKIVDPTLKILK